MTGSAQVGPLDDKFELDDFLVRDQLYKNMFLHGSIGQKN